MLKNCNILIRSVNYTLASNSFFTLYLCMCCCHIAIGTCLLHIDHIIVTRDNKVRTVDNSDFYSVATLKEVEIDIDGLHLNTRFKLKNLRS